MIIGVPREVKNNEYRVALTPAGCSALVKQGHKVMIERDAGEGSGFTNEQYIRAGGMLCANVANLYEDAQLIVKVKEPQPSEFQYYREGQILFTYLHLAAEEEVTKFLLEKKVTAIAYETIETRDGKLPLLIPMSMVAGRMSIQIGAHYLERHPGGRGILLSGIPGTPAADVVILGAGTVGTHAARIALGMGANVTLIDTNLQKLDYLSEVLHGNLTTIASNEENIARSVAYADLFIGAVLLPGGKAPRLVTREMVKAMKKSSVIIDVDVDQGGCIETARPTTHADPVYEIEGIIHYGVTNIPGAVPRTSTFGLTNATIPYVQQLAGKGLQALKENPELMKGLNTHQGQLCHPAVAQTFNLPWIKPEEALQ